jgi:hypothetical protein
VGVFVIDSCTNLANSAVQRLAKHYVEGIAWVLHYYYQGVSFVPSSYLSLLTT